MKKDGVAAQGGAGEETDLMVLTPSTPPSFSKVSTESVDSVEEWQEPTTLPLSSARPPPWLFSCDSGCLSAKFRHKKKGKLLSRGERS